MHFGFRISVTTNGVLSFVFSSFVFVFCCFISTLLAIPGADTFSFFFFSPSSSFLPSVIVLHYENGIMGHELQRKTFVRSFSSFFFLIHFLFLPVGVVISGAVCKEYLWRWSVCFFISLCHRWCWGFGPNRIKTGCSVSSSLSCYLSCYRTLYSSSTFYMFIGWDHTMPGQARRQRSGLGFVLAFGFCFVL